MAKVARKAKWLLSLTGEALIWLLLLWVSIVFAVLIWGVLTAPRAHQAKTMTLIQRLASSASQSSHQCHK
jgi:type IV secretory pathway TrbD component